MRILFGQTYVPQTSAPQKQSFASGIQPAHTGTTDIVDIQFGLSTDTRNVRRFLERHGQRLKDTDIEHSEATWQMYQQGTPESQEAVQKTLDAVRAVSRNTRVANHLQELTRPENLEQIDDPVLRRWAELLEEEYETKDPKFPEERAVEDEIGDRRKDLSALYNTFRAQLDGETITQSEVGETLQSTGDPAKAKAVWEANGEHGTHRAKDADGNPTGPSVAEELVSLVKRRNEFVKLYNQRPAEDKKPDAQHFDNYYSYQLHEYGVNEEELVRLLEEVERVTDGPFRQLQEKLDGVIMERFGVDASETRQPWLQKGNEKRLMDFDPDSFFRGKDPVPLAQATAARMGGSLDTILSKSDLYYDPERPGKTQHAFNFGIDPPNDIRDIANIDPKLQSLMARNFETVFHEVMGHGLDYQGIDENLPPQLRRLYSIETEGHAMMMGDLPTDLEFLTEIMGVPKDEAVKLSERAKQNGLAAQVTMLRGFLRIINFEREMYKNPDQDLQKLWWDLSERYLGVERPEGREDKVDWDVIHYISHPGYYPNYLYGQLWRAQVLDHIKNNFGSLLTTEAGDYLNSHRATGKLYKMDELIQRMTGKPLDADALKTELAELEL